jgi:hypothetical protein
LFSTSRNFFSLLVLLGTIAAMPLQVTPARGQGSDTKPAADPPVAQPIVVPDGTEVELRFAQPVMGKAARKNPFVPGSVHEAEAGDEVRLVAAANVRIDGRIVIAKGAVGKATVTDALPVFSKRGASDETGLFLQLEWIRNVNDVEMPLRAFRKGKPEKFHAAVKSDRGGVVVHPEKGLALFAAASDSDDDVPADKKRKNWIPPGSRLTAFVQGAVSLDRSAVDEAQAQLPLSPSTATLTIYRTQDGHHSSAPVLCDGSPLAQLGERQYAVVQLAPGAHSFQIAGGKPFAVTAAFGEEYFLLLRPRTFGDWELKPVSTSEGEDSIAGAEMVTP